MEKQQRRRANFGFDGCNYFVERGGRGPLLDILAFTVIAGTWVDERDVILGMDVFLYSYTYLVFNWFLICTNCKCCLGSFMFVSDFDR